MPFYLFGTEQQQHIDHMLLKAPNAQLTAEQVSLDLGGQSLTADQLEKGVLVFLDRHEIAMQPFNKTNPPLFFSPSTQFNIKIYDDTNAADAHGPGLADITSSTELATGTLTLPATVFKDWLVLNTEDFANPTPLVTHHTSSKMNARQKAGWSAMMSDRLGVGI